MYIHTVCPFTAIIITLFILFIFIFIFIFHLLIKYFSCFIKFFSVEARSG